MIGRRGWRLWAVYLVGLLVMVEETVELKLSHHLHGDMGEISCNFGSLQKAPSSGTKSFKQVKVVLKTESEEDMVVLQGRAKSLQLPNHITIDAGRTQIAPNSRTVMAILGPADLVDDVTGGLKLL